MDVLDISRWQFGITSVYHYIFVPLTIGLGPLVALMQTFWQITAKEYWYRATRFFGTIFLINFAMGVATGIVQEFQFGMNWSQYSIMVGDVFGGPLALEALIAFFLESVFLGVWIFGWGKVPGWLHNAAIWIVAIATNISAYFIITANSFMQNPKGAWFNPETGRAELESITELLFNHTAVYGTLHAVTSAFLVGATFILGVSCWWLVRSRHLAQKHGWAPDSAEIQRHSGYRPMIKLGLWSTVLASLGVFITGDLQAKLMFEQQPMKMAAAESLCHTETDPNFSILTIGTHNNCDSVHHLIELPHILPFLAEGKFSGVTLQGALDLQQQYETLYGPGNYIPNLFVTYWSFRAMIGLMLGSLVLAFIAWLFTRKNKAPEGTWAKWFGRGALIAIPFPYLANMSGWVFAEMGRQPWIVHPNPKHVGDPRTELIRMTIAEGVSEHSAAYVWITLIGFTLIYALLFVVWYWLIRRAVLFGPPYAGAPEFHADGRIVGPASAVGTDLPMGIEPVHFGLRKEAAQAGTATDTGYNLSTVLGSSTGVLLADASQNHRASSAPETKKD
ncbi:cytochrome ubiquinol oxidase subunit I [Corynebacterium caspium]|uniref:cytochrome ubiquinol oxidase subunit I n=1 Tax=Corynebacterium caspium TaxID=234828 RepID=UPI0003645685|nr:cytochrome ubiquinol oxidase subunit I [Corynebacterium caspium]WKD59490.1 Cytochrome bd-I ubiquinol oxidase subunit 1 [Corynebacterium caspium DSM 44850]